jgi:hypothetical protein
MPRSQECFVFDYDKKNNKKYYVESYGRVTRYTNASFTEEIDRAMIMPLDAARTISRLERLQIGRRG